MSRSQIRYSYLNDYFNKLNFINFLEIKSLFPLSVVHSKYIITISSKLSIHVYIYIYIKYTTKRQVVHKIACWKNIRSNVLFYIS
jgi:hypothetical protein